jgi:hypothetical protein
LQQKLKKRFLQLLIHSVFNRQFEPFLQRTLKLLDEAEQKVNQKPPAIEDLVEALMRPMVEGGFSAERKIIPFMRLMGRYQSEPNPEIQRYNRSYTQPIFSRFAAAITAC